MPQSKSSAPKQQPKPQTKVQPQVNEEITEKKAQGRFPRWPLRAVMPLVDAIYELTEDERVRRLMVFDKLGKSPTSSASRQWLQWQMAVMVSSKDRIMRII
jgi:hypothetical protein